MASELTERDLYAGRYHLVHNPDARGRAPRYVVTDKQTGEVTKPKGVTTILGKTLSKDLIPWAVGAAIDYLRIKTPVVTEEDLVIASVEYERLRDAGGSTGSEAHAMVENYLKKQALPAKATKEARNAYQAFAGWFEKTKPEVLNIENLIYSAEFKYCGTYDMMLKIGDSTYLCDLKTTNASRTAPNGVYAEHFIQLGAYALAHDEQRQFEEANGGTELPKIDGLCVISAKKNGALDVITESDLGLSVDDCKSTFKRVINVHNFMLYTAEQLGGK